MEFEPQREMSDRVSEALQEASVLKALRKFGAELSRRGCEALGWNRASKA